MHHQPIQPFDLPEILHQISAHIPPQNQKTKSSLFQINSASQHHLRSSLVKQISVKISSVDSVVAFLSRSTSYGLKFCEDLKIKDEDENVFQLEDFTARNEQWSNDLIRVLERLGRAQKKLFRSDGFQPFKSNTGIKSFSFQTQREDFNPHATISPSAWKKLAINLSEVLRELILDLGQDNDKAWPIFQHSTFKNLSKLRLRLNPREDWDGEELQATLNRLDGLKEFSLRFFSRGTFNLVKLTLENEHPNLNSLELDLPLQFYQDLRLATFINRHRSTLQILCIPTHVDDRVISLIEQLEEDTLTNLEALTLPDIYILGQLERFLKKLKVLRVGIDLETSLELLEKEDKVFTSTVTAVQVEARETTSIDEVIEQMISLVGIFPGLREIGLILPSASKSDLSESKGHPSSTSRSTTGLNGHSLLTPSDIPQITEFLLKSIEKRLGERGLKFLGALDIDFSNHFDKSPDPEKIHLQLKAVFKSHISDSDSTEGCFTDLKIEYQGFETHIWVTSRPQGHVNSSSELNFYSNSPVFFKDFDSSFSQRNLREPLVPSTIYDHLA